MKAPVTIVLKTHPMRISSANPSSSPHQRRLRRPDDVETTQERIGQGWSAEFVGGPHSGEMVTGCRTIDEAIGMLIRKVARGYDTADGIVDFFATLFGSHPHRTVEQQLARAVRLSSDNVRRQHPGVQFVVPVTPPQPRTPVVVEGGAA